MRSKGSEKQADVGGLLATQDHGGTGAPVDVKGLDAGRAILIWVTPRPLQHLGLSCCLDPCLSPWSFCSWGLCWCLWPMLTQWAVRILHVGVRGLYWANHTLHRTWDRWSCPLLEITLHQESWPCPLWEGELHPTYAPNSENGPIPHHGCGRAGLDGMGIGELALPITWEGQFQWSRLTNSTTTLIHILGLDLAYLNIYPIYDLLGIVKRLILQNDCHRIFTTQDNSRRAKRSISEDPLMMVCQRSKARARLKTCCIACLWVGQIEQKSILG